VEARPAFFAAMGMPPTPLGSDAGSGALRGAYMPRQAFSSTTINTTFRSHLHAQRVYGEEGSSRTDPQLTKLASSAQNGLN
jgi:hypothetical protein